MARLVRLAHQVKDHVVALDVEVEIDLHAARVRVSWHGIPHVVRIQQRDAHHQLAAFRAIGMDVLVDRALVGIGDAAQVGRLRRVDRDVRGRVGVVGRRAAQVKAGRVGRVRAGEHDVTRAHADVQPVQAIHGVLGPVRRDGARAAHVHNAQLAPLQEEVRAQLLRIALQRHAAAGGVRAAGDDPVDVAVDQLDLVLNEQPLDQELAAKLLGRVFLDFCGMRRITHFHDNACSS